MVMVIPGATTCRVCNRVIEANDELVAINGFVANDGDALAQFNDAVFHEECFSRHRLSERCRTVYGMVKQGLGPGQRVCAVCSGTIDDPDEYFTFGCVTSDEANAANWLNSLQFHLSCVSSWSPLGDAVETLSGGLRTGTLLGAAIERLVDVIRRHAP